MRILFLCTGNACRSQMAEGWTRHLHPEIDVASAGVVKHGLDPRAVEAMAEAGVDISAHESKTIDDLRAAGEDLTFDYVITLCDDARKGCPHFPGEAVIVHQPFPDPPRLAREDIAAGNDSAALAHYRRVRDNIREFVEGLPGNLPKPAASGSRLPPPNLGL